MIGNLDELIAYLQQLQQQLQQQINQQEAQKGMAQAQPQTPAPQPDQQQGGGGMSPSTIMNMFNSGGGEAGAGGGEAGAGGMMPMMGYIAAAILGQHLASKGTDTEVNGQKTGDVFSGSFATEPWLAFLHNKLGLAPTAGEKFDAAIKNKDYGEAAKGLPAAADYWADPIRTWLGSAGEAIGGKTLSTILNPIGALFDLF